MKKLRPQAHSIDLSRCDIDIGRIGAMREGAHEQPVFARSESVEYESSGAVGSDGRMLRVGTIARRSRKNRIVRKGAARIRESANYPTETGSE